MNSTASQPTTTTPLRRFGRGVATFLAFPIGASIAHLVAGNVDSPSSALAGGLITGAVIGAGQALGSSGRLSTSRWTAGTSLGLAAGLTAGAALVDYDTSLGALATMGAVSGLGVGIGQAVAWGSRLPRARRLAWAAFIPALWALGWTITTSIGVSVSQQWTVFGSAGAIVAAAGFAAALELASPAPALTAPAAQGSTEVSA